MKCLHHVLRFSGRLQVHQWPYCTVTTHDQRYRHNANEKQKLRLANAKDKYDLEAGREERRRRCVCEGGGVECK